jgi:hypothetical protein
VFLTKPWSSGGVWAAASHPLIAEIVSAAVAFAAVAGLAADNGGYFPTTWGWASVALLGIAAAFLALGGLPRWSVLDKVVLGTVVALSAWTFVSSIWSISVTRSMLEGERSLVYVGGVLVALLSSRRQGGRAIVLGTWLATTAVCVYALLTRLFPEQFGSYDALSENRLSAPIGYWNALGLFAAIGCLLALGLAARSGVFVRMAAAASIVVLVLTLYFTFGRGAWIALFAGLAATVVVDRRRLQLITTGLLVAVWPAIGVYFASRSTALTRRIVDVPISAAERDGHALAIICVLLMTGAALSVLVLDALESRPRLTPGRRLRLVFASVLVCLLAVACAAAVARYGSPMTIARDAWHSFTSSPAPGGSNLNNRLLNLSGNGRIQHWRVAVHEIKAHPWLGSGAGTYAEYWFQLRRYPQIVHDAHSLYLETLAELGPIGLALLGLLFAALILGAVRSRSPLAAVAVGTLVAYGFHAAADWDWELPALLLALLMPAVAVAGDPPRRTAISRRIVPTVAIVLVGGFALFTLLGNIAIDRSGHAADATHYKQAESEARNALSLVPWSAEPLRKLAVAQVGLHQIRAAQASLRDAVSLEPRDWSLWYQLSEVSTGPLHRRALAEANRLDPQRTSSEATPGDLRLVLVP